MKLLLFNLATDADDPILGFTTRWIQALAKRVEFIHVITMRAGRVEVPANVRIYSVGKEKGYSEPRRAVEFYRHLFRILREDRIDACFSHMIPIFTVLAAPVLKVKRIPIVTWYLHPSLTFTLKLAHHLSDRIVTALETSYPYRKDKVIMVGHGIDTDLFCPDGSPPEEPPMILCVGRLSPVKDHPTLIRAAALLRERWRKPFRVVILGGPAGPKDEPYVRSLHQLVEELNLQDIVSFHPPVPQSALPNWYRRCTVLVNMTPTGSGDKVVWEAMACGRPCLAANEGFQETMGRWSDWLLFRYSEPSDLAGKLETLLNIDYNQLREMSIELRQRVIERHSLARLTEKLVTLFETLIQQRDRG